MSAKGSVKKPLFSRYPSENVNPQATPLTNTNFKLFQRPLSAFGRHRVRELSDIREVSGSSKGGTIRKKSSGAVDGPADSAQHDPPVTQVVSRKEQSSDQTTDLHEVNPVRGLGSRATSTLSLPLKDVPARRSSATALGKNVISRQSSVQDFPSWKLPAPSTAGQAIPSRGRADSPVRKSIQQAPVSSEDLRRSPSKTFIRTAPPLGLIDSGNLRHDRIEMSVGLLAPLFVGGGTVEGHINLIIDGGNFPKTKSKQLHISNLTIDILGVEEVSDGRRWIFLSLASDLFDDAHPPPPSLVSAEKQISHSEVVWPLKPSNVNLPFCMNLPLNVGPPPYVSKQAAIRYFLCPTAFVKVGGKQIVVRQICNIQMMTVHDPEKALASLPNPLLACDSISIPSGVQIHHIKLTAGLHRQTWVNGARIFVDVHISNPTSKTLKKIELQLEKITLWYSHAAAGTGGKSASHLRLPRRSNEEVVSTSVIKKSKEWKGILPNSSELRTCEIDVPKGHVTISTGRYFEVRYFLNITVCVSKFKTIAVQLPVTIIHINSLDILPNALAQVAASIEAKRAKTVPILDDSGFYHRFHQGQAFSAPRRQSLDRMRNESGGFDAEELSALTTELEDSPRHYQRSKDQRSRRKTTMDRLFTGENVPMGRPSGSSSSHHHHMRRPSCYHCHIAYSQCTTRHPSSASLSGPRLPRLQLSTSGLGFSDSEFELAPDSPPRKVMLSESEREMILRQREIKLHRQKSQKVQGMQSIASSVHEEDVFTNPKDGYRGWRNVAAESEKNTGENVFTNGSTEGIRRGSSVKVERTSIKQPGPTRMRSRTNPEHLRTEALTRRRGQRASDRLANQKLRPSLDRTSYAGSEHKSRSIRQARPSLDRW